LVRSHGQLLSVTAIYSFEIAPLISIQRQLESVGCKALTLYLFGGAPDLQLIQNCLEKPNISQHYIESKREKEMTDNSKYSPGRTLPTNKYNTT